MGCAGSRWQVRSRTTGVSFRSILDGIWFGQENRIDLDQSCSVGGPDQSWAVLNGSEPFRHLPRVREAVGDYYCKVPRWLWGPTDP